MNELLTRRPERPMPPGHHEQRRQELLAAIEEETERRRRRFATPLLAAAAVLAVIAGLAFGIPALRNNARPPATGTPENSLGHPPPIRTLSATEKAAFLRQCATVFSKRASGSPNGNPNWFTGYQAVDGFEFTKVTDPGQTKAWLVTHSGPEGLLCGRNGAGVVSDAAPANYDDGTKPIPLRAPVEPLTRNAGQALNRVTRVTHQAGNGPEIDAYLLHGYWFTPTPGRGTLLPGGPPYDPLTPLLPGETVRGYDANGKLVYNSANQPPPWGSCYMDPSGKRVHMNNGVKTPGPKTCHPTYNWPE
ncbi:MULTISPECIES: hypothetical protein [unclassified Kribbella]|uniref:hypothetical protein n=1 Tax=unclassified Kribbella TaxID=2644121 RepID=UPI003019E910